jgi:competence protein ComFC
MKEWFLDLLFPPGSLCLICNDPRNADLRDGICFSCKKKLDGLRIQKNFCTRCLSPIRYGKQCDYCKSGGMEGLSAAFSPFNYHDEARALIIRLKFGFSNEPAYLLGREMASELPHLSFSALVPVPLHKTRERERGANQARLLCTEVSRITGIAIQDALIRHKPTYAQSSLGRKARKTNVENAFTCITTVKGMDLLLTDDVRTTGATARACAKALLDAGAASVCLLTACIAASSPSGKRGHK